MWNNDDDVNDSGDPVELYLPIETVLRKSNIAPQDSHIGGLPSFDEYFIPPCDLCGDKMFLLAQLRLQLSSSEMERYLCSFCCAREDCWEQISYNKGFASSSEGLKGVVKCMEKRIPIVSKEKAKAVATPSKASSWYDDNNDNNSDDDDGWGMGDADDENNVNLEDAVADMERKLDDGGAIVTATPSKKPANKGNKPSSKDGALESAYGCYLLKKQHEPPSKKSYLEDEDDVGGISESDEKIRNMLARYMAEEEDEEILAALGGGAGSMGGGGNNNGEEDERLSEEDRILRTFQDRQKRAPKQVIRYASGGKPLWSIPDKNRKSGKTLWSVPESSTTGEPSQFEFQILPSILAALEVDQHPATKMTSAEKTTPSTLDQLMSNGVNFGSIAVFTDPASVQESGEGEAFVVIQKSVDDLPLATNKSAACAEEAFPAASMAVVEDLDDDDEFEIDA